MEADRFGGGKLAVRRFSAEIKGQRIVAGIQPECGANLVSLEVDGREFLYYSEQRLRGPVGRFSGCFMMFPTPCHVADGRYEFQGRVVTQQKEGRLSTIHGVVRDEAFETEISGGEARCRLEIEPGRPVYEAFPFRGRLSVSMKLIPGGLEYSFSFENRGESPAPAGFGIHPFWRLPGRREDVFLRVPCRRRMVEEGMFCTGEVRPVTGTPFDLLRPRPLSELDLDTAFLDRIGGESPTIEFRDLGKRLTLRADPVFTHHVVYCPPGQPFFCLENLTCAPNAVTLQALPPEISGFRALPPGGSLSGTTRFVVEDL